MLNEKAFRDVVVSLYDGATGAAPWNVFLSDVAEALSATTIVLFSQVPGQSKSTFLGKVGFDSKGQQQYQEYFAARNILMIEGAALHVPGVVRTSETICRREQLLNSEYYNDFMRPNNVRYSIAITPLREDRTDRAVHLSAFRPYGAPAFDQCDMRVLSQLDLHLRWALQVHFRLNEADQHARALEEVVDRTGKGVAFLDRGGEVLYVNAALEQIFTLRDGLALTRRGVSPANARTARALRAAVADASQGGSGGTVAVGRPSGKPSYSVVVCPVLRRMPFLGRSQAAVLIVVSDPAAVASGPCVLMLQQMYGLTPAEASIASRLASGATLRDIANHLGISIHTARTHLKRVLAKTDTHRQSELVRRLLLGGGR